MPVDYIINIAIIIMFFMIQAQGYNLILGFTGLFHMGHIAFVAIGAYAMAIMLTTGFSFLLSLLVTVLVTGVAAVIVGIPTLRLKEDYLVIATLGFGLIVHKVIENWMSLTGGPYGIDHIPRPEIFGLTFIGDGRFLIFVALITLLVHLFVYRVVKSAYGKVLETIREDEVAAMAIGINTFKYKLQVLVMGAVIAGLGGALAAQYYLIISPRSYSLIEMVYILMMVVLGGTGNFWGGVLGAVLVNVIIEVFRFVPVPDHMQGALRVMFFSATLIALMIWRPNGLLGKKILGRKY